MLRAGRHQRSIIITYRTFLRRTQAGQTGFAARAIAHNLQLPLTTENWRTGARATGGAQLELSLMKLPFQLHASPNDWDGTLYAPPNEGRPSFDDKPAGFFWTSSERTDGSSAWLEICSNPPISRPPVSIHRFEVVDSPRILVLRRENDLLRLATEHGVVSAPPDTEDWREYALEPHGGETLSQYLKRRVGVTLNTNEFWGVMQDHWDAVHVPEDAKFTEDWIGSFEIESTVWFRPQHFLAHRGRLSSVVSS